MILNNRFEEPYNKYPADGPLPLLSKPIVISKLSKKFWLYSEYLRNEEILSQEPSLEENDNIYENFEEKNNERKIPLNNNNDIQIKEDPKIRPKSNYAYDGIYGKRKKNAKKSNRNSIQEINKLNDIILKLQSELNKQDFIINSQINEKMKLAKRIHELEQVMNNFC